MGETNNFPGLKNETETETFNFGLMEPRPRPRLSFWVSWNRDRDRDFNMKSRETETFTRPDILSLGGTETGTETTKVSVPRVSAPRPPISALFMFIDLFSVHVTISIFLCSCHRKIKETKKQNNIRYKCPS